MRRSKIAFLMLDACRRQGNILLLQTSETARLDEMLCAGIGPEVYYDCRKAVERAVRISGE